MEDSWHSYPKIYNLGHPAVADLFKEGVVVQEKVDGSQFSFGMFEGGPRVKSKNKQMVVDAPDKMFEKACETVLSIADKLTPGWTYRAEYLQKPKHNVLAYDRAPEKHLILFDINIGFETYADPQTIADEAARLGLECVPLLHTGPVASVEALGELLENVSVLGGSKIEGIVAKNYLRFCVDGKAMMGKYVSEKFKEVKGSDWNKRNPTKGDVIVELCDRYRSPARWEKAIQHMRERGELTSTPADIGALINEARKDLAEECKDEIAAELVKWAFPKILRAATHGLPEYYKSQLAAAQFDDEAA